MAKWHMTRDRTAQFGPYEDEQLRQLVAEGRIVATDLLWQEGTPEWVPAAAVPGLISRTSGLPGAPPPPPVVGHQGGYDPSTKIVAGICGILFGYLGVHKFIVGNTRPAVIMLLVTILTCGLGTLVMYPIGFIEGIIYLSKSDDDFYQTYIVGKREWF